jgi:hypothetical protein
MINPAKRTELVNEYYFSVKLEQIAQMNKSGEKVLNLGILAALICCLLSCLEVFAQEVVKTRVSAYQGYKGIPELRKSLFKLV